MAERRKEEKREESRRETESHRGEE